MEYGLLALVAAAFLYVAYLAVLGNAASVQLIGSFTIASLMAWGLSVMEPSWAARIKWVWVALSLLVAYGIVSGPLDYLRLNTVG